MLVCLVALVCTNGAAGVRLRGDVCSLCCWSATAWGRVLLLALKISSTYIFFHIGVGYYNDVGWIANGRGSTTNV